MPHEPKYRRHSSGLFAFVEFQGRRQRLPGDYNSRESRAAYHRFLQNAIYGPEASARAEAAGIHLAAARTMRNGKITVSGLILAWLDWARLTYETGHSSEYTNCRHAVAPLRTLFGRCAVDEFGPVKLKRVQQALEAAGRSRQYINGQIGRLKRMFKWGVSEELVSPTVYQALQTVAGLRAGRTKAKEQQERQPAKWEEVEPVFAHLPPTVAAMLWLQWYTGARTKSVCLAKPEQFDRGKNPWEWRPRHKTEYRGKKATIFIGPKLQAVLLPFFERQPDAFLFSPREAATWWNDRRAEDVTKSRRQNLTNGRIRDRYDTGSYRQAIRRAQDKAGVPHWTPHQIRHALATSVREAHGLEAAQAVLCHESLAATQIYARRQEETARKIAAETG